MKWRRGADTTAALIRALRPAGQRGGDVGGEGQSQAIADAAAALARLPDGFAPKKL